MSNGSGRPASQEALAEQRQAIAQVRRREARIELLEEQLERGGQELAAERLQLQADRELVRDAGRRRRTLMHEQREAQASGASGERIAADGRDYIPLSSDGRVFVGAHYSPQEDPRGSRTAVIDRLRAAGGGPLPLAALLEAAGPHVGSENSARMLVSRLTAQGDLVRVKQGTYRLPLVDEVKQDDEASGAS